MLPKPDELLALHSIAKRLFDTLQNWFEIEPKVTIDLTEVDSAVIELSSPHMIIAMAMRETSSVTSYLHTWSPYIHRHRYSNCK